ncbi:hypothetical protein KIN20_005324 [Parelaphostrongylus tenuis]|uniref:Uncharacterized protein n=1 Tax=Parelaphostrongylus tenuis TaxID=148309 RepID=A0AAD5QHD7_PARTN|nr:hypothetical protein KIN20_005324 [Parelaphostrongylus tenuis]
MKDSVEGIFTFWLSMLSPRYGGNIRIVRKLVLFFRIHLSWLFAVQDLFHLTDRGPANHVVGYAIFPQHGSKRLNEDH